MRVDDRFRFRIWDKEDKYMIVAELMDTCRPELSAGFPDYRLTVIDDNYHKDGGTTNQDERYVIMQSTGLLDKNGKEIFEGDIVRCVFGNRCECVGDSLKIIPGTEVYGIHTVRWIKERAEFDVPMSDSREVIGNIYEEKE